MKNRLFTLLLLLAGVLPAQADVLVLVHGFLGSSRSWLESGVIDILSRNGYPLAGNCAPGAGEVNLTTFGTAGDNAVYTVDLPSTAPIAVQASSLSACLRDLHKHHPHAPFTLIGHSAGGVVARMSLVRDHPQGVTRLITIAAPNLGTWRAYQALDVIDDSGPLGFVKRWGVKEHIGGWLYYTLKASRGVLHDLTPARPGNLLFWLNSQPHPDIEYISIIRQGTTFMPGDRVVPGFSQDLRQVPALAGRARAYTTWEGHLLSPQDGQVIVNLLAAETQAPPPAAQEPPPRATPAYRPLR